MAFINYFSLEHLLNLTLFGVVFLVWLILNRWINKSLEGYLKQKGWLVAGREKNIKKLIKMFSIVPICYKHVFIIKTHTKHLLNFPEPLNTHKKWAHGLDS